MPQIKGVRKYSSDRWLVQYAELALCGCYWKRRVLWLKQTTEPTTQQILDEINDQRERIRLTVGFGSN